MSKAGDASRTGRLSSLPSQRARASEVAWAGEPVSGATGRGHVVGRGHAIGRGHRRSPGPPSGSRTTRPTPAAGGVSATSRVAWYAQVIMALPVTVGGPP